MYARWVAIYTASFAFRHNWNRFTIRCNSTNNHGIYTWWHEHRRKSFRSALWIEINKPKLSPQLYYLLCSQLQWMSLELCISTRMIKHTHISLCAMLSLSLFLFLHFIVVWVCCLQNIHVLCCFLCMRVRASFLCALAPLISNEWNRRKFWFSFSLRANRSRTENFHLEKETLRTNQPHCAGKRTRKNYSTK